MLRKNNYLQYLLVLILGVSLLGSCRSRESKITTDFGENQLILNDVKYKSEFYKKIINSAENIFKLNFFLKTDVINFKKNINVVQLSTKQDSPQELQERIKQLEDKITSIESQQSFNLIIIYFILLVSVFLQVISFYKKIKVTPIPIENPQFFKPSSPQQKTVTPEVENPRLPDSSSAANPQKNFKQISNVNNQSITSSELTSSKKPVKHLSSQEREIIQIYNNSPEVLSRDAYEVTETEDSIYQRRFGSSQLVILESVNRGRGNYWILSDKYFNYLVPKIGIKINEYNYKTLEALFICHNNQSGNYSNFELIKPSKISIKSKGLKWELIEKGELHFK